MPAVSAVQLMVELLKEQRGLLSGLQRRYRQILVDEFQDLNL